MGACSGDAIVPPDHAVLSVALTDAPFPFDSIARADIYVVRIDAKVANTDSLQADTGVDDSITNHDPARGWVTIASPNQSYNLLDLQGGQTANLGQAVLPTGTYQGFRLILDTDKSSITLANGTVLSGANGKIKFPSAAHTGIKVQLDHPILLTSGETQMVIDFDLGQSFVLRGNSIGRNGLLFKPVIRGTARDVAGTIQGIVHATSDTGAVVPNAFVEVLKAGTSEADTVSANVVATTTTDSAGVYTVHFLLPASYAVRVTPSDSTTNGTGFLSDVTVETGGTTEADVVLP
jgi:hypothetical protein